MYVFSVCAVTGFSFMIKLVLFVVRSCLLQRVQIVCSSDRYTVYDQFHIAVLVSLIDSLYLTS